MILRRATKQVGSRHNIERMCPKEAYMSPPKRTTTSKPCSQRGEGRAVTQFFRAKVPGGLGLSIGSSKVRKVSMRGEVKNNCVSGSATVSGDIFTCGVHSAVGCCSRRQRSDMADAGPHRKNSSVPPAVARRRFMTELKRRGLNIGHRRIKALHASERISVVRTETQGRRTNRSTRKPVSGPYLCVIYPNQNTAAYQLP
jgi:hypothetical protein